MQHAVDSPLPGWESYYVIVGSSAGALTGLQFVVIALAADARKRAFSGEIDAFATPTIVHFCVVLLVSAVLSAPWHALSGAAALLGVCGFAGLGYVAIVTRRARRQRGYQPVLEDWIWHIALPFVGYVTLLSSAIALGRHAGAALFVIAAAALLLLFVGIHNAWDAATFLAAERLSAPEDSNAGT